MQNSAELDLQAVEGDLQETQGMFADNLLKEAGMQLPDNPDFSNGPFVHIDEDGDSLEANEPQTFVYDEWDFRAADYKPRWCIVRQKMMAEGDPNFYGATLQQLWRAGNEDSQTVRDDGARDVPPRAQARRRRGDRHRRPHRGHR